MKKITRAKLRGEKLDEDCKKAYITTEHYTDKKTQTRIKATYCYGWEDCRTDEPLEKCKKCRAFVKNIED